MNERIIELIDIAPKDFWGAQDTHLEMIKKYYPKLKIVARGTILKAFGEKAELDEFENRFNRLMLHFTRYNNIDANVIDVLTDIAPAIRADSEGPEFVISWGSDA